MTDKLKIMTDNEIIKALECCIKDNCDCGECPAIPVCQHDFDCLKTIALDLINRQKAEIESLNSRIFALNDTNKILMDSQEVYWRNKVKEFAERLKKELSFGKYIQADQIDNLLKEKVGEQNG